MSRVSPISLWRRTRVHICMVGAFRFFCNYVPDPNFKIYVFVEWQSFVDHWRLAQCCLVFTAQACEYRWCLVPFQSLSNQNRTNPFKDYSWSQGNETFVPDPVSKVYVFVWDDHTSTKSSQWFLQHGCEFVCACTVCVAGARNPSFQFLSFPTLPNDVPDANFKIYVLLNCSVSST